MHRPVTTLFLLMSVDGKISPGSTDNLDVDKDFPLIDMVKEGLYQYYDIEKETDLWSLNSGRVQDKIGVNQKIMMPDKTPVSYVVIDNSHLTENGIKYFCAKSDKFVLVTANANHPAFYVDDPTLNIIYQPDSNLLEILKRLKSDCGCERITVQTGGTLNSLFLREKLIDYVDVVVAPILVGGKDTPTLIDGQSITSTSELWKLGALKLMDCKVLEHSYIRLKYKVMS